MQKQPSKGFFKEGVMRNFVEFTRKHVAESFFFFFDKVKNETLALIFLVNFAKFVRAPFLQNTPRRLLLIIAVSIVLVMKRELASETVNYDTKTMYQFEPKCNLLRSTLQVKQQVQKQSFVGF